MRALEGVRVLDFSVGHDASAATMYMADHGAEVIKIENSAVGGDVARNWAPIKNGKSAYFELLNRGKKSVALDFGKPETRDTLLQLIKTVDVVVDNLPVDQLADMGLSYEVMSETNPEVIYAKLTPYGMTGPMRNYPGTEFTTFAYSGFLQVTGFPQERPTVAGYPIMGYSAAHYLLGAVTAALIARMETDRGQMLDLSMADLSMSMLEDRYASLELEGIDSRRCGNAHPTITPYDTIACKDGYVNISPSTPKMWEDFCTVLEFPEIMHVPEYENMELRQYAYFQGDLKTRIETALKKYTKQEAAKLLNDVGIPAAPVCTVSEAYHSEQLAIKNVVIKKHDEVLGDYAVPSSLAEMSATPSDVSAPAPALGAHNASVLGANR